MMKKIGSVSRIKSKNIMDFWNKYSFFKADL